MGTLSISIYYQTNNAILYCVPLIMGYYNIGSLIKYFILYREKGNKYFQGEYKYIGISFSVKKNILSFQEEGINTHNLLIII